MKINYSHLKLSVFLMVLLYLASTNYAGSTGKFQGSEQITELQKELAKQMGIILIGMTN